MKLALLILFAASFAGAQTPRSGWCYQTNPPMCMQPVIKMCSGLTGECEVPQLTFRTDNDVNRGCYRASEREGWKCIGGTRPQLWMLMPLVEPLPPKHYARACDERKVPSYCVPEPMDVPAIQATAPDSGQLSGPLVLRDPNNCVDGWINNELYGTHCASRKYWTCADESRILLTAEDGTRHCVKF